MENNMTPTLEKQLDLAHRLLAKCEEKALRLITGKHRIDHDLEIARAIIETIEARIASRSADVRKISAKTALFLIALGFVASALSIHLGGAA